MAKELAKLLGVVITLFLLWLAALSVVIYILSNVVKAVFF